MESENKAGAGTGAEFTAQVIVAGAGPVGLSAAVALRSKGLDVLLLEAEPQARVRAGSRAIFIQREPLDHIDAFCPGITREIMDNGLMWQARRYTYRGKEFYKRSYKPDATGSVNYATSQPQQDIERVLMAAAKRLGVRFAWNTPVARVETKADGVNVITESGAVYQASYVVGADGSRSPIRKSLGIKLEGSTSDAAFIIVDVGDLPDHPLPLELSFHYEHPAVGGRNLLMVPMKGAWRVDLQCLPGDHVEHLASDEGVQEWLPKVMPAAFTKNIRWVSQYRFRQLVANRLTDDTRRVLLVGEAAHLFAPWGGRGLNSGFIDAAYAATAIVDALKAKDAATARAAVDRFASERYEAAQYNISRAAFGLKLLAPTTLADKLRRRVAGMLAPMMKTAARWLASGPNGGDGEGRPGKTAY